MWFSVSVRKPKRARADSKAKTKEAREAKAAAPEAARMAKAHEPDLDDLDLPDAGRRTSRRASGFASVEIAGNGQNHKAVGVNLAALETKDDDSLSGDLDEKKSRQLLAVVVEKPSLRNRPVVGHALQPSRLPILAATKIVWILMQTLTLIG